jgi:hypothetical protein
LAALAPSGPSQPLYSPKQAIPSPSGVLRVRFLDRRSALPSPFRDQSLGDPVRIAMALKKSSPSRRPIRHIITSNTNMCSISL